MLIKDIIKKQRFMMIIENVDWQITSMCNRKCAYCYGPTYHDELSIDKAKAVVDILASNGVKQIGLTGGEPLLYSCIKELVDYIFGKGIKIYLSTNCDLYQENAEWIKEKVSIIGVPIDGSCSEINDSIRGTGSFNAVTNAIRDIINSKSSLKIKCGTVVTNQNIEDLLNIERFLMQFQNRILFWKLYELILYEKNIENSKKLQTMLDFSYTSLLGEQLGKEKVIIDTIQKRNRSYFFVDPIGNIFIPILSTNLSEERILGNILKDDISVILAKFEKVFSPIGYNKTYRYMKNS